MAFLRRVVAGVGAGSRLTKRTGLVRRPSWKAGGALVTAGLRRFVAVGDFVKLLSWCNVEGVIYRCSFSFILLS